MTEDELIAHYLEPHPSKGGFDEARLIKYGISVWILVSAWEMADGDVCQVVREYDIPIEAVRAVLAYYRRHRLLITARLTMEAAVSDVHHAGAYTGQ